MNKYMLVLTTVPDEGTGQKIAKKLIEERLAACVTVSVASQSLYWWQGKITQDQELILFIKTKATHFSQLEEKILELHPYEIPEIIVMPIINGYTKYLDWIDKETKG